MNDKLEKKLDLALENLINSEIPAPEQLVKKVNNNILQKNYGKKNRLILTSFIPAAIIILANIVLVLVLIFSNLHFTQSPLESILVIYLGFSALSLLGVFVLALFELRSESAVKKNMLKTLGG